MDDILMTEQLDKAMYVLIHEKGCLGVVMTTRKSDLTLVPILCVVGEEDEEGNCRVVPLGIAVHNITELYINPSSIEQGEA